MERLSWTWGVTFSSTPTFSRLMVWNGLLAPSVVVVKEPVRNGICWPEMLVASSLSSVSTLGLESRLDWVSVARAVTMAPRPMPLALMRARAMVGDVKPLAMASGSTVTLLFSPKRVSRLPMMPFSVVLSTGTVLAPASPTASSTPAVSTVFTDTSTTAASISTCARRTSSCATVARISFSVVGLARIIRAFRVLSARMFATGPVPVSSMAPWLTSLSSSGARVSASAWLSCSTCAALVAVSSTSSCATSRSTSAMAWALPLSTSELSRSLATICTRRGPLALLPSSSGAISSSTAARLPTHAYSK